MSSAPLRSHFAETLYQKISAPPLSPPTAEERTQVSAESQPWEHRGDGINAENELEENREARKTARLADGGRKLKGEEGRCSLSEEPPASYRHRKVIPLKRQKRMKEREGAARGGQTGRGAVACVRLTSETHPELSIWETEGRERHRRSIWRKYENKIKSLSFAGSSGVRREAGWQREVPAIQRSEPVGLCRAEHRWAHLHVHAASEMRSEGEPAQAAWAAHAGNSRGSHRAGSRVSTPCVHISKHANAPFSGKQCLRSHIRLSDNTVPIRMPHKQGEVVPLLGPTSPPLPSLSPLH
ncbi:unnamed protein product [Leuciscus chuanchicus]